MPFINCGRVFTGDIIEETQAEFLPFDDDFMVYDINLRKYTLLPAATKTFLNLDLKIKLGSSKEEDIYLAEIRDIVYRESFRSGYNDNVDIVRFKIARTALGRQTIFDAMLSMVRYGIRTGKFLLEDVDSLSPNAKNDLWNGKLWHKGRYSYKLNPEQKDVGY